RHIIDGIRNGFNVGISEPPTISHTFENHSSSLLNPSIIDSYILSEQAAGRYSIGFSPADLEQLIGTFRTYPLGLVPKTSLEQVPHSPRTLSYPRNLSDIQSVNAGINAD
ncbi:hypothetical protein DFH29DRAFT_819527, partial [Suillus ampliporus]